MNVSDCLHLLIGFDCIGVADVDVLTTVLYIAARIPNANAKIDGKIVSVDRALATELSQSTKTIGIGLAASDFNELVVQIESYQRVEPGKWLSSNPTNRLLRAIYGDFLDQPGLVKATDVLGAPSLRERAEELPVDAVYTWVNHEDPDWQRMYRSKAIRTVFILSMCNWP